MANEIVNAVSLLRDGDFRDWVVAAACYQASNVLTNSGSTAAAKKMATDVLLSPRGSITDRLVNILATQSAIFTVGATVGNAPNQIGQTLLVTQMASIWNPLSAILYP